MGYDIHITRKEDWFDDSESHEDRITLAEWLSYADRDHEFRSAEDERGEGSFFWRRSSAFDWEDGEIVVVDANSDAIRKALKIAKFFQAKVQGDEGEIYETEKTLNEPGRKNEPRFSIKTLPRRHWQIILGALVGALLLTGLLILLLD